MYTPLYITNGLSLRRKHLKEACCWKCDWVIRTIAIAAGAGRVMYKCLGLSRPSWVISQCWPSWSFPYWLLPFDHSEAKLVMPKPQGMSPGYIKTIQAADEASVCYMMVVLCNKPNAWCNYGSCADYAWLFPWGIGLWCYYCIFTSFTCYSQDAQMTDIAFYPPHCILAFCRWGRCATIPIY